MPACGWKANHTTKRQKKREETQIPQYRGEKARVQTKQKGTGLHKSGEFQTESVSVLGDPTDQHQ